MLGLGVTAVLLGCLWVGLGGAEDPVSQGAEAGTPAGEPGIKSAQPEAAVATQPAPGATKPGAEPTRQAAEPGQPGVEGADRQAGGAQARDKGAPERGPAESSAAEKDTAEKEGAEKQGVDEAAAQGTQRAAVPARREPIMEVDLSLEDAIRMGLENNLNVKLSRLDERIRQREIVIAEAVFDPFFNLGTTYGKNRDPSVSLLTGTTPTLGLSVSPSSNLSYYGSFTGKYLLGTQYELRLSQSELDRPEVNRSFTFLNPVVQTAVTASLRQPLLKGAWYSVNTADVRIAENNSLLAKDQLELTVIDTVFQIEAAYWDLKFAIENVGAKKQALALTQDNLENVRKKKVIGTLAAIDITTAESQVAIRRTELEEAYLVQDDTRDRLLSVINYTRDQSMKALWEAGSKLGPFDNIRVVCTSVPDPGGVSVGRNEALAAAFTKRPEYRQLELTLRNGEIRVDVAKNGLLPSLDVVGEWSQLGLEDSFGGSFSELGSGRYYDWLAGVEFAIPIGNRAARNTYRNLRDEVRRVKIQKQDLENQIVLEVDTALRTIDSLRRRSADLDERVRLQRELLRAERVKLEVGKSIAYAVSVIENDLVDNIAQALRTKALLQRAKAELYRATGSLLERHRIEVVSE